MGRLRKFIAFVPRVVDVESPYDHTVDVDAAAGTAIAWWVPDGAPLPRWPDDAFVWEVDEREQWDSERAPGVKTISFLHRLPSLTREQFADHWSNNHAPLARRHHPAITRYVQNVVIEQVTTDGPDIDGIAELSFVSFDNWKARQYDSDEGKRIITEDVARFLQLPGAFRLVANEVRLRARNPSPAS